MMNEVREMKKENPVQEKSYALALRIVELYKYLTEEKKEFVLSKQILRSGTKQALEPMLRRLKVHTQSEKDFLSKMSIAYKEARETKYWLRLLNDSGGYLEKNPTESLFHDVEEVLKLIGPIQKTMKHKIHNS